tara:strand:+ start:95 stop:586 length:492 start_codon:yes stop_codon:yes gene_type:complete
MVLSCDNDNTIIQYQNEKVPLSIAQDFKMEYTDSTVTKSIVSAEYHYDFTNDSLNYSEFFENVKLTIYDDSKVSIINSDYAIVFNSYKFIEFSGNVNIKTSKNEVLKSNKLYYDTENEWLFTEEEFEYEDESNKIIANRLDSNRDFTDLVTGSLTGTINISDQ